MSTTRRDYDPTERPLAFDERDLPPRRGPMPVTLILSLLLLVGLGGGVYYLYRGGVRAPSGPPAPVGVPIRDVRVAAPPQPQQPDPAAGLSIYKDTPGTPTAQAGPAPSFVAPPEQPTPRPVAGQEVLEAPTATPIAAAPAEAMPAKPVRTASIDTILASNNTPAKATTATVKSATAAVKAAAAKPTATAVKTADTSPDQAAKPGSFVVQIGAFSSQAQAEKSWDAAAGVAPGAMAGKGKHIAPLSKDGATLYRVAITGFDSRASAQALCAKLSAAGRTCFVR